MVKVLQLINSEPLYVKYTQPLHHIKNYTTGQNKDNSWVTITKEQQWNDGTHTTRKSNIVHLQNLTNITINLEKDGQPVMN